MISFCLDDLDNIKIFPIATDLLLEQGYPRTYRKQGEPNWECHFSPKQYLEMHPEPDLERMRLSDDRLRRYGEQVTKIRAWILERALAVDVGPKLEPGMLLEQVSNVEKKKWQRLRKKQQE